MESRSSADKSVIDSEISKQAVGVSLLQQQLSLSSEQDLIKAEYGTANGAEQQLHGSSELGYGAVSAETLYVGVHKVPGRAR